MCPGRQQEAQSDGALVSVLRSSEPYTAAAATHPRMLSARLKGRSRTDSQTPPSCNTSRFSNHDNPVSSRAVEWGAPSPPAPEPHRAQVTAGRRVQRQDGIVDHFEDSRVSRAPLCVGWCWYRWRLNRWLATRRRPPFIHRSIERLSAPRHPSTRPA